MDDLIFQAALDLHEKDLVVLPIRADKEPYISLVADGWGLRWKNGQPRADVEQIFGGFPKWGVGVLLHPGNDLFGIDADGQHGPALLASLNIDLPPTYEEMTPGGGRHYAYRLPENTPRSLKKKVRLTADSCGGSGCGVDALVGPNSYLIISPSPGYIPTNDITIADRAIIPQEFLDLLPTEWEPSGEPRDDRDPDWVEKYLLGPIPKGLREDQGIALAGHYAKKGYDLDTGRAILEPWSQNACKPPMSDADWKKFWRGAQGIFKKEWAKQDAEQDERFSQAWTARRFAETVQDRALYSQPARSYIIWTTKLWEEDVTLAVERMGEEVVTEIIDEALLESERTRKVHLLEMAVKLETRAGFDAMLDMAKRKLAIRPSDFDTDLMLWNTESGTLTLPEGTMRPHDPKDRITKFSPVRYDPQSLCPEWDKFQQEIFPDDAGQETIEFLDEWFGYCMTGSIDEDMFLIFYGTGMNGKRTLVNTIGRVFGSYMRTAPADIFIKKKYTRHEEEFASLRGSRLVIISETDKSHVLDGAKIKAYTGGDRVTDRHLYRSREEYTPTYKFVIQTNHKPRIYEATKAIWRRIVLIRFDVTIPDEQRIVGLEKHFIPEVPGIMARFVKGCERWHRRLRETGKGLKIPSSIEQATTEYRRESDSLLLFFERRCVFLMSEWVSRKVFNDEFKGFCDTHKFYHPGAVEIVERLRATEGVSEVIREGKRGWKGLRLTRNGWDLEAGPEPQKVE